MTTKASPTLERVLELAKRSAEQVEVFSVVTDETPVRFEANRLKQLSTRQTQGIALRVIKNGRIGFAATTRTGDIEGLVGMALEVAPFGAEAKFSFPAATAYPDVPVYDEAAAAVPTDAMAQLGQSLIDRVRAAAPDLMCEGSVRRAVQRVRLLTSAGADVSYRKSTFSVNVEGTLVRGTDMLFVGDGEASCHPFDDTKGIERNMLQQLAWARETAAPCTTGALPVIFTPQGFATTFLAPLGSAFSGRSVYLGSSPIGHRLGERLYDERVTIVDDATTAFRPSSRAVDDEGAPSRRVALVERGVIANFLYDLQTAGLAGAQSTGHGERSLATQPAIGFGTLIVSEGERSFDEMVGGIDEGVVVEMLMGATQGNVQGGEFSGNVLLGYKIERGRIVGRVKNTMVAGNAHRALAEVMAVGSEGRWLGGSLFTPPIAFSGLSVSSTG